VRADLIGLCFNCFRTDHISRNCPYPICCLRCREPRHLAQDCSQPCLLLGDRRHGRSRSRSHRRRQSLQPHRSRRPSPTVLQSAPNSPSPDQILPGSSCSTGLEGSPPAICESPSSSSSPSLSPSPPPSSATSEEASGPDGLLRSARSDHSLGASSWWRCHHCGGRALALSSGRGGHHSRDGVATRTAGPSRPAVRGSLSLNLPLTARRLGRGNYGMNIHHGVDAGTSRTTNYVYFLVRQILNWF
jgi:hypothetical protein